MGNNHSLEARSLRKRYGSTHALDGFDLSVQAGTIHGLLGPNGAGKSTAVKGLCTLIDLDDGEAVVAGYDVARQPGQVRRRIGLVGQNAAVDEVITGAENLIMFGRLFGLTKRAAAARATELLTQFGLPDAARRPVSTYSGGMRRRLDIAAGLILTPAVLFLDEPTTGLDPRARNEVWASVRLVADQGTTVLLTTQYLDEADQLAAVISVMDHGRVIAQDTPDALKRQLGGDRVTITVFEADQVPALAAALERVSTDPVIIDAEARTLTVEASRGGPATLADCVRALDATGIEAEDVMLRRPTLDEVFLALTDREDVSR
ncbi:ATP-binding cassette domain-containing protein [Microlunatus parietis]|uniref:ABC-2 type transport system ATP-binding protein n=1 Tax=Microlunatus parietis TaxID=682979 RepID=A0A7Y9LC39_9ACTN|nr:ATP-binding cassette domain-containing protein [Microlunatus parietis]NYE71473.1 ABC-2 type transport system ATP-binding protein [Microlunatus parietis]